METMVNVIATNALFRADSPAHAAEDRLSMLELPNRFEECFDARRLAELKALLTEDVAIDYMSSLASTRAEAMRTLTDVVPFRGIHHRATNATVFTNDAGEPCVLSHPMVVEVYDDQSKVTDQLPRVLTHALVTDRMRKAAEGWRIAGRMFEQMRLTRDYVPTEGGWRKLQQTTAEHTTERAGDASEAAE